MDISAYLVTVSSAMSHAQTNQSVGLAVAKKAMDTQQIQATDLVAMLKQPSSGGMDIRV